MVAIDDPRAMPVVWAVFVTPEPADQARAVQLLGQLDGGHASRGLAALAAFSPDAEVRRRPIESIRVGDVVLTQDPTTGALDYRPVLAVFHNPPAETLTVDLGGRGVASTGIHRFWEAGKGWTMARDLEPGDRVRTLGGTEVVGSVETASVQPVFNLEVADSHAFFAGEAGALVHDNSLVQPVAEPFDAPRAVAAK